MSAALPAEAAFAPMPHRSSSSGEDEPPLHTAGQPSRRGAAPLSDVAPAIPEPMRSILARARFAPSGDNTQPWRFEVVSEKHVIIHGRDTRHECVYDLRGHASLIALGALLETIAIAASTYNLRARFARRTDTPDDQPTFDAYFEASSAPAADPLAAMIEQRVTQRRPLKSRALTADQISALQASLPPGYRVEFRQSFSERFRIARLLYKSAHIRLTTREAYETHRKVIEWNATFSDDRIPDQAVGVDIITRKLMRWAMASWSRISFLNRFLAGTVLPRVQLDFLPGLRCAGHFFLIADKPATTIDDHLDAGRALQRFWLTATQQGLLAQPEMTPLIFAQYDRQAIRFSESAPALRRATAIRLQLETLLTPDICQRTVFMGRIGTGAEPKSRSLRLPLDQLITPPPSQFALQRADKR